MFCPQCKTGFDWNTLSILRDGQNTNPLYYEWRRAQGLNAREIGDIPCGGMPGIRAFCRLFHLYDVGISPDQAAAIYQVHQHNLQIEMPNYRVSDSVSLNEFLRVQYILGKLDKKTWVAKLKNSYKKQQKTRAVFEVLESHNMTLTDIFIEIGSREIDEIRFAELCFTMMHLVNYTNTALDKLRLRFRVVVPLIDVDYQIKSAKISNSGEVVITRANQVLTRRRRRTNV
jgi:hypothetical protein